MRRNSDWGDQPSGQRSPWAMVLLIGVPLLFTGIAVWWLESRFGSGVALMILGGLVGVICVIVGILLSAAIQKFTLGTAAEFNRNLAEVERARAQTDRARIGIDKERARSERHLTEARSRLEVIDAKRLDQLARERTRFLLGDERRRQDDAPTWADYADPDEEEAPPGWGDPNEETPPGWGNQKTGRKNDKRPGAGYRFLE